MRNNDFPYDYKKDLFGKFSIFVNKSGELEIANHDKELVLQNRITGIHHKENIFDFINFIKTVFPTKQEQKDLLYEIFNT